MEKEEMCFDGAVIERGIVTAASSGSYTVKSYGRDGLTAEGITALVGAPYAVNEKVYYFMFDDGRGGIIGRFS